MNYSLAKELKDAGFPQGLMPYYDSEGYIHRTEEEIEKWVYEPSLSELIEACVDLNILRKTVEGWAAYPFASSDVVCTGITPEEAVARLWLALNKKIT